MAFDEELAERVRAVLAGDAGVDERRMFGGLAFLLGGRMAVVVSRAGGLMVRVDPGESAALVARPGVEPMVMRGRETAGWLRVAADRVADDAALTEWVRRGVAALPPG